MGFSDSDKKKGEKKTLLARTGPFLFDRSDLFLKTPQKKKDGRPHNVEPPVFSIHRTLNARHGYFERLYYSRTRHDSYKTYLWAPWIIEYMLKKNGFTNVEVKPYADPYNMAQTYLHTAKSPNH